MIYPGYKKGVEPPESAIHIEGQMSDARRQRLQKRLRRRWLNKHAREAGFDLDRVEQIRQYPHIEHVAVQQRVHLRIQLGKKKVNGVLNGIIGRESSTIQRVVAGETVEENDSEGILLSEFTAYDLGYRTDEQLKSLIGREVELSLIVGRVSCLTLPTLPSVPGPVIWSNRL